MAGSTYLLGMILGALVIGIISDKFGRKIGLMVAVIVYGSASLVCAIAPNYLVFLAFRVLAGAGGVALFQVAFVIGKFSSSKFHAR